MSIGFFSNQKVFLFSTIAAAKADNIRVYEKNFESIFSALFVFADPEPEG